MAKELPYYKFEPNQWENGNIQMCTHEEKGVFVDLCSMYWSRLGDVPYKLAVQKICGGNANALRTLYESKIFEIIDDNIYIKFLSEQLNEFEITSERNTKIAKEGWEKRRKQKEVCERNANALPTQSERNAIREEKIRENKIKEDIKTEEELSDLFQEFFNSPTSDAMIKNNCQLHHLEEKAIRKRMKDYWLQKSFTFEANKSIHDIRSHFTNWLKLDLKANPPFRINQ
jgi:hypothetical protein